MKPKSHKEKKDTQKTILDVLVVPQETPSKRGLIMWLLENLGKKWSKISCAKALEKLNIEDTKPNRKQWYNLKSEFTKSTKSKKSISYHNFKINSSVLYLENLTVGEAIREYLRTMGSGNPYGFYKLWRQVKKVTSYDSIRKTFWILKQLGLIEFAGYGHETKGFTKAFRKRFYRITRGMKEDERWRSAQSELYPDTGLGSKGYAKLAEKGLKPKGGRAFQIETLNLSGRYPKSLHDR